MADRIDDEYGRELQKEVRVERQADLQAAGDLLNADQQREIKAFLVDKCWLKPAAAADVLDTINSLAGDVGGKANSGFGQPKLADQIQSVVHDALEGHVSAKFLNNADNFKPITAMLTQAVEARETRIEALHAPAGKGPAVAAQAPKTPAR